MTWNIAEAKQRFSELVKQAIAEPQLIYNRNQPVAAVVGAEEYARFQEWRAAQDKQRSMAEAFEELRTLLTEEGFEDGLELPFRADRANGFAAVLEEAADELPG